MKDVLERYFNVFTILLALLIIVGFVFVRYQAKVFQRS